MFHILVVERANTNTVTLFDIPLLFDDDHRLIAKEPRIGAVQVERLSYTIAALGFAGLNFLSHVDATPFLFSAIAVASLIKTDFSCIVNIE